jgi:hypothetical protein
MAPRIPALWHASAERIAGGDENAFLRAPASKQRIKRRCALTDARTMCPRKITGSTKGA